MASDGGGLKSRINSKCLNHCLPPAFERSVEVGVRTSIVLFGGMFDDVMIKFRFK
jgi:hypothetical protein